MTWNRIFGLLALTLLSGCSASPDVTKGDGGSGGAGLGGEGPGTGINPVDLPDDDGSSCKPKTCKELGKNCGVVADGCGNVLECGSCADGLPCGAFAANVCPTAEEYADLCKPQTREEACAGKECGVEGDGCGGTYVCGTCASGEGCGLERAFACSPLPTSSDDDCPARIESCAAAGAECGLIGNGCGGTIDCDAETGGCSPGEFCGFGGPGRCGPLPTCTPLDPAVACAGKCGLVSDGCSGTIDCLAAFPCPAGQSCGGGGTPNECGNGVGTCQALTREAACGSRECGQAGDGCGDAYACGPANGECAADELCRDGVCEPKCVALTREAACAGKECGVVSDGCAGTYTCGTCDGYDECGFLEPFQCDFDPDNVPEDECEPIAPEVACSGRACGVVFDGCGTSTEHRIDCAAVNGGCAAGQFCGLTSPFQCDAPQHPECVPTASSCVEMGWACGLAVNECGQVFDCAAEDPSRVCQGASRCVGGIDGPTTCAGDPACTLCASVPSCSEGSPTRLRGRVITPGQSNGTTANHVGVPNAFVYIAQSNDPSVLPTLSTGITDDGSSCERCREEDLGPVLVSAVTDASGAFTLEGNVPVGTEFLLVVKAGKFRRAVHYTLPASAACQETLLPTTMAQGNPTRLPRHRNDGVAVHVPHIAISTGAIDAMECVFYKMGIAASEMTRPSRDGRIHLYHQNGGWPDSDARECNACSTSNGNNSAGNAARTCRRTYCGNGTDDTNENRTVVLDAMRAARLYEDSGRILEYDMAVFDCEGGDWDQNLSRKSHNLRRYVNQGGRLFASHLSSTWLHRDADDSGAVPYDEADPVATGLGLASSWASDYGTLYDDGTGQITLPSLVTPWPWAGSPSSRIDAFRAWMVNENLTSGPNYTFPLIEPRSMSTGPGTHAEIFVRVTNNNQRVQQFSFDTPYGAPEEAACGRVAYSGFHVAAAGTSSYTPFQNLAFPSYCTGSLGNNGVLTRQEKILLYMLFDLGACVGGEPDPPSCAERACPSDGTCGVLANGCGGSIECGCPAGEACVNGTCEPPGCVRTTCAAEGVTCSTISDGCGGAIECDCPVCQRLSQAEACAGVSCGYASDGCSGVLFCGDDCPPDCQPLSACPSGLDCGLVSDGCSGVLDCGDCELPEVCGAQSPNRCDVPECTPLTCEDLGAQCGKVGDGCGGSDDCGECPRGQLCTTVDGVPNRCLGCQPIACEDVDAECGAIGDGCGGTVDCGVCPEGLVCGAESPNRCGKGPTCTPRSCAAAGAECGTIGDGCGGTVDCGDCPAGQVCGFETPFLCGTPPPCVPETCSSLGAQCGAIGDGCGGLLECGPCPNGLCGANQPNRCSQVR